MPEIENVFGNAMVDKETYTPVGFCLFYFEPGNVVSIHAHFGKYLRQYTPQIMAGMAPVCQKVVDAGITEFYAIADEDVQGSADLIKWLGGEKTDHRNMTPPVGFVYRIDVNNPKMKGWLKRRGKR